MYEAYRLAIFLLSTGKETIYIYMFWQRNYQPFDYTFFILFMQIRAIMIDVNTKYAPVTVDYVKVSILFKHVKLK